MSQSDRESKLDEVLARLIRAADADQAVDRRRILAEHPEFAAEIEAFFAHQGRMEQMIGPLRDAAPRALNVRCPHCRNPIELLDQLITEINCPSCGSSFSLAGTEDTAGYAVRGAQTFGHFELIEQVGVGQFGSVWKARDTKLDRTVAIKIPRQSQLDKNQAELFLRDARAAAQLRHPNIVSVHEVGRENDTIYIVSDFVAGATLKQWLTAKRLTPSESAELCIKIAKALQHAHEAGVVHRDLKPGNIMMDAGGEPHLVDFGLAKRDAGEITMTVEGQILGTPAYMSPEQAKGEGYKADCRADIYSLGVILFELLTGELPFRGDKQMLIVQILSDEPPSLRRLNNRIPRDLETICLKCLEKDPPQRYNSADELAADLSRFVTGHPISARPVTTPARVWRWSRRNPIVAGLTAMVALLLIGTSVASTVGLLWKWRADDVSGQLAEEKGIRGSLEVDQLINRARQYSLGSRSPDFPEALRLINLAMKSRPDDAELLSLRGEVHLELGDYEAALEDLEQSLVIRSTDHRARWLAIFAAIESGDRKKASQLFTLAQAAGADQISTLIGQGLLSESTTETIEKLSRAIDLHTDEPRVHELRGRAAYRVLARTCDKAYYDQAVSDFRMALAARPYDDRIAVRLCQCLTLFHFLSDIDVHPLVQAEAMLGRLHARQPDNESVLLLQAVLHTHQHQYNAALQICQRQSNDPAALPDFTLMEARILAKKGSEQAALDAYARSEGLAPPELLPATHLAIGAERSRLRKRGGGDPTPYGARDAWLHEDWLAAAELHSPSWYDRWIRVTPRNALAWFAKARYLDDWHVAPTEDDLFTRAIELAPSLAEAWYQRARGRIEVKRYREARDDFERFLMVGGETIAPSQIGEVVKFYLDCPEPRLRDPARAEQLAERLVDADPSASQAWSMLGRARQFRKRIKSARRAMDVAVELSPHTPFYRLLRAEVLQDLGDFDNALLDYEFYANRDLIRSRTTRLHTVVRSMSLAAAAPNQFKARAVELAQLAMGATRKGSPQPVLGAALYRMGEYEKAVSHLTGVDPAKDPHAGLFLALAQYQVGQRRAASSLYSQSTHQIEKTGERSLIRLREEASRELKIGWTQLQQQRGNQPGDWSMWGGSGSRNNTPDGDGIVAEWRVGAIDRKTGEHDPTDAKNIKWVAKLGSQSYGNVVVANGRVFVGTNNGAGYLAEYPPTVDLGCLLCFRESDGEFLWQYSAEKLRTGRVHDWPLQGIAATPLVEGKRLWVVDNRGQVMCLDTEGFDDDEDDGPERGTWKTLFAADLQPHSPLDRLTLPRVVAESLKAFGFVFARDHFIVRDAVNLWSIRTRTTRDAAQRKLFELEVIDGKLVMRGVAGGEPLLEIIADRPFYDFGSSDVVRELNDRFAAKNVVLPNDIEIRPLESQPGWAFQLKEDGKEVDYRVVQVGGRLLAQRRRPTNPREADVVWRFDMMSRLGVSQHNLCTCAVASWGDLLFVCTSNGVDESHIHIPAPGAPSFIALNKHTGEIVWTDNSPGENIMHGQWSAPAVGELGGVPQVIFGGGDGWVYAFHAEKYSDRKPQLLWKFDANPKESKWVLGGRGTRNNVVAIPVIHDGLVYVSVGQDPEHGEDLGRLWCLNPNLRGDVSPDLAMRREDGALRPIPHRRLQAVNAEQGEVTFANPNSAVVWEYSTRDRNRDGQIDFEEEFHRSLSSVVVKDDILFTADFSGIVHCLNAKTGLLYWTYDMLSTCWGSPLLVDNKVYIGDEDGEVTVFPAVFEADEVGVGSIVGIQPSPIAENFLHNSVYSTPIVANGVLFVADRTHLFAIADPKKAMAAPIDVQQTRVGESTETQLPVIEDSREAILAALDADEFGVREAAYRHLIKRSPQAVRAILSESQRGPRSGHVGRLLKIIRSERVVHSHKTPVHAAKFIPNSNRLVSTSGDSDSGAIRIFDLTSGRYLPQTRFSNAPIKDAAVSRDGRFLATGGEDKKVAIWDLRTRESVHVLKDHYGFIWGLDFSEDGRWLASASVDGDVRIWDPNTGDCLNVLQGHRSAVCWVAFSPDGERLASASYDKTIRIWNTKAWELERVLKGHAGPIRCVEFSMDGKHIASASQDGTVRIWNAATGEIESTLVDHNGIVLRVAYSPDGKFLVSSGSGGAIRIWNAASGQAMAVIQNGSQVNSLDFSADGAFLLTGDAQHAVKLWEYRNWLVE